MPLHLVELYAGTAHLGDQRNEMWRELLEEQRDYPDIFNLLAKGTGLTQPLPD